MIKYYCWYILFWNRNSSLVVLQSIENKGTYTVVPLTPPSISKHSFTSSLSEKLASDRTRQSNFLQFRNGGCRTVSLGGKNTVNVKPGDRLTILTPGGGGHGSPSPSMITSNGVEGNGNRRDEGGDATAEDPDRKSRRLADMRLSGSVSGYRLGQEQA